MGQKKNAARFGIARAAKTLRDTGVVTSTGVKGRSNKPPNPEKPTESRDFKEKAAKFVQRVGKPGPKHGGVIHEDPMKKINTIRGSHQRLEKFNSIHGFQKPKKPNLKDGFVDFAVTLNMVSMAYAKKKNVHQSHIRTFVAHFMSDGFNFIDMSTVLMDNETFIISFIEQFLDQYYSKTTTSGDLKILINSLDSSAEFWRSFTKKYGYFMVPGGVRDIGEERTIVHRVPLSKLKEASIAFIRAKNRKMTKPTKIVGAGVVSAPSTDNSSNVSKIDLGNVVMPPSKMAFSRQSSTTKPTNIISSVAGAGKFIGSNVKNSGTGGKSKIKREPLPPKNSKQSEEKEKPVVVENNREASAMRKIDEQKLIDQFMCTDELDHEATFSHDEIGRIVGHFEPAYINSVGPAGYVVPGRGTDLTIKSFDQWGSPFCGLAAIDLASKIKPRADKYIKYLAAHRLDEVMNVVGVPAFLDRYAGRNKFNLAIIAAGQVHLSNRVHDKWILLRHEDDHYTTVCRGSASSNNLFITGCFKKENRRWFTGDLSMIDVNEPVQEKSSTDRRTYVDRRDKKLYNSASQKVVYTTKNFYTKKFWFIYSLVHFLIIYNGIGISSVQDFALFLIVLFLSCLLFIWWNVKRTHLTYNVDSIRFHLKFKEVQLAASMGLGVDDCLLSVAQGRELNDVSNPCAVMDTIQALRKVYECLPHGSSDYDKFNYHAVNAPNQAAIIPNLDVIIANQEEGVLLGGGVNHFTQIPERPLKTFINKPVASAPVGVIRNGDRILTPGLVSITDEIGLLAGIAGRGMSKENVEENFDFMKCSYGFIDTLIQNTDCGSVKQKDKFTAYRNIYRGKKSSKVIEGDINRYKKFLDGKMSVREEKKFKSHSLFIKLESNIKMLGDLLKVRPRTIMTMAPKLLLDLCSICDVIHALYKGPMAEYQVKNLDVFQMAAKVVQLQNQKHVVTDYSAFESSIRAWMRKLEMYFLRKFSEKCGLYDLVRTLDEWKLDDGRTLDNGPIHWFVETRCSGDFWTSFGNGLVAICLMHYCHSQKDVDSPFSMIAEGDDGLINHEIPDVDLLLSLGLKFSTAIAGSVPGDTDFLSARWVEHSGKFHRLTNIGKAFNVFWVRKGHGLRKSKQLYLLRIKALSLWHSSPGCPIITEICQRIEKLTRGKMKFKGAEKYLDVWKDKDLTGNFPEMKIVEGLDRFIAEGAVGFPPIPIIIQKWLRKRLMLEGDINLWSVLDDYDSVKQLSDVSDPSRVSWDSADMDSLSQGLGITLEKLDLSDYKNQSVLRTSPL